MHHCYDGSSDNSSNCGHVYVNILSVVTVYMVVCTSNVTLYGKHSHLLITCTSCVNTGGKCYFHLI